MKLDKKTLYSLNIRERLIIAGTILFIAGYLVYNLIIPPVLYHCKIAKRQLYVQKNLIEAREKKTKELLRLKDSFKDLETNMLARKKMFLTDAEALDFLNNLDLWAKETDTALEEIKPESSRVICDSRSEEGICYKDNVVKVHLVGRYNGLLELFKRFADYEKLLGVRELSLRHTRDDRELLDARFTLNIYILGEK